MWSDTSVEAAHAVLRSAGCYAPWDVLRAALEAAERAAMCDPTPEQTNAQWHVAQAIAFPASVGMSRACTEKFRPIRIFLLPMS